MQGRTTMSILNRFFIPVLAALALVAPANAGVRLKDILNVEGVRDNQLLGYGIVTGLNGTGDSLRNCPMTRQAMQAMTERLGNNTGTSTVNSKNTAAVMVTANLPAFATSGSRLDVTVSSLCDGASLDGGTLIATPLMGADNQVYVVAQGSVAVGGFTAKGDSGSQITRNIPTTGRIPSGGLIERQLNFDLAGQSQLRLSLRNPDFTTAQRVAGAINAFIGMDAANASDSSTVRLIRPKEYKGDMASLIAEIELLQIEPDQVARITISSATGVIVMGDNVRVSTVAIAQGNLTIQVQEQPSVSQPNPLAQGQTVVVPQSNVSAKEDERHLAYLKGGVPLKELVNGLNALGVTPRDMISILQALKASGALQAEIEVM
jgi:flagellar P-ring protein precursor FlgI